MHVCMYIFNFTRRCNRCAFDSPFITGESLQRFFAPATQSRRRQ